jgi:hypothetical protein
MQLQQNDDPIFADIDLYRSAKSKWQAMSDDVSGKVIDWNAGKVIDCACDATTEAWYLLEEMTPTTAAGFVAKAPGAGGRGHHRSRRGRCGRHPAHDIRRFRRA